MSRRQRRRVLAEAVERGDVTFGQDEDVEARNRFVAWGLSSGGTGSEQRARGVSLGTPFPIAKEEFPDDQVLVRFVAERGVNATLRMTRPPPQSSAVPTPMLFLLDRNAAQDVRVCSSRVEQSTATPRVP